MEVFKFTFVSILVFMINAQLFSQVNSLGLFENHQDIGEVKIPGSVSYNAEDQEYLIAGAGENIWFEQDQFHFLWKSVQGDFILRAKVSFIGEGVDPHRKLGLMVRNSFDSGSAHVNAAVHGDGLSSLQYRMKKGAITREVVSESKSPYVIQLERKGDTFIMGIASEGEPLNKIEVSRVGILNEAFIGLYVCSHKENVLEKAIFSDVRIIKAFDENEEQYEKYLGSNLEIIDIESGQRKVLMQSAHRIQAPNWTHDGKKIIFNSNGYLYTYDLETDQVHLLETGFALDNNNDHVISFDGKQLGISHHDSDDNGESVIYTLPVEGSSQPKRITKKGAGHSYLHGWSVDGESLLFTGERNGQYDVYSVSVQTGEETQLTNTIGLDDGPEFSPDGRFIYFNSNRTGTMQIWRMDPDGSNQKQLTFDEWNDWFPHLSPDGKNMIFLSFGTDVDSGDHPFYKHVVLRMMPAAGGKPSILTYVYGGQGTINVPSWSPDGKKVAFISNSGQH